MLATLLISWTFGSRMSSACATPLLRLWATADAVSRSLRAAHAA